MALQNAFENLSTETKQDAANALLTAISGKDFATQTTLAAILAKIIAAPSTEAKQDSILAKMAALLTEAPGVSTPAAPVRQVGSDIWRVGFHAVGSGVQTAELSLKQTGSGMTVNQSAGNLVITTGTTANSETLIRSLRTFRAPLSQRYRVTLSQRIAQNNFYFEMADLIGEALAYTINSATSVTVVIPGTTFNSTNVGQSINLAVITGAAGIPGRYAIASVSGTSVTFTVAGWPSSGSGTLTLYGWNTYKTLYSGTTAAEMKIDAARNGWSAGEVSQNGVTTAGNGVVLNMYTDGQLVAWQGTNNQPTTGYIWNNQSNRVENIPDLTTDLYFFIRVLNGTSAPATTTTCTVAFIGVEMDNNVRVFLAGNNPNPQHQALSVTGNVAVNQSGGWVIGVQPNTSSTNSIEVNSLASTNAGVARSVATNLYTVFVSNQNAAIRYLKIYNKASAPTVGTDVPVMVIPVPAGGFVNIDCTSMGQRFTLGIAYAITTGMADSDTGAVAANEIKVKFTFL